MSKSDLESLFAEQLTIAGIGGWVREFKFHPIRKWAWDFSWNDRLIAFEIEGGVFTGGRHGRGSGILKDIEKSNAAALLGWRTLRATGTMVRNGTALRIVEAALSGVQVVE